MGGGASKYKNQGDIVITDVKRTPTQGSQLESGTGGVPPTGPSAASVTSDSDPTSPTSGGTKSSNAWATLVDLESRPQDVAANGCAPHRHTGHTPTKGASMTDYARVVIQEPVGVVFGDEAADAARRILKCLEIRKKYLLSAVAPPVEPATTKYLAKAADKLEQAALTAQLDGESNLRALERRRIEWDPFGNNAPGPDPAFEVAAEGGVFYAAVKATGKPLSASSIVKVAEFSSDYSEVLRTMKDRGCISFCNPRLLELELKYDLYMHRNAGREAQRQSSQSGRDWYQIRKVDTHIHHSACFSQRRLMQFIRQKMREEVDTPVLEDHGKILTLREVFSTVGINDAEGVTADRMCCMASIGTGGGADTFGRFDKFNKKFDPFGDKRLRDIFLKTDNYIEGRFLAELTKEVMASYAQAKSICAEWRISIYGRNAEEWRKLARWFRRHHIMCPQVRWLIQVPRLYPLFRKLGAVKNFAELLQNIFKPLFEASLDPSSHEDMFYMLQQVIGFDSVDDESQGSNMTLKKYPSAEAWDGEENPPYTYWMYHMYANIRSLNALRSHRGLSTFSFRPHCGEAGNISHLCSGFMLADGVCHGVQLKESPVLQYLFYLAQVGLAVSPLSNDILFIPLSESPFGTLFRRGLNVSLSTDDPLIIHMTEDSLIEEYVVAARTFRLSVCDLCEIARNSVLQSGFERAFKEWWVGNPDATPEANDEAKTNVPTIRLRFRADCLAQEMEVLVAASSE